MVNEEFWVKCSECPLIFIFTMQVYGETRKPRMCGGTPPSTFRGSTTDKGATLAADFLAEIEKGIEILRKVSSLLQTKNESSDRFDS
jgi:hypothetical protein